MWGWGGEGGRKKRRWGKGVNTCKENASGVAEAFQLKELHRNAWRLSVIDVYVGGWGWFNLLFPSF